MALQVLVLRVKLMLCQIFFAQYKRILTVQFAVSVVWEEMCFCLAAVDQMSQGENSQK